MASSSIKVGIIGGSGFYSMDELTDKEEVKVETEFGEPSDTITKGRIGNTECFVLARHGRHHTYNPTEVNYRANVRALQKLGVTHILSATACGSLKEELKPGDMVVLDSFVDRTTKRLQTFYDQSASLGAGTVSHIPMSPAFCEDTKSILVKSGRELGFGIHSEGVVVTIEGPRFSSKAESKLFRAWGCDVVNMTTVPEVVLAAEAGISYASVATVTDYDCWKEGEEAVCVEQVLLTLKNNIENVKKLFVKAVLNMEKNRWEEVIEKNKAKAAGSVLKH